MLNLRADFILGIAWDAEDLRGPSELIAEKGAWSGEDHSTALAAQCFLDAFMPAGFLRQLWNSAGISPMRSGFR